MAFAKFGARQALFALFLSPTGTGLKVIVPIEADASKHEQRFKDAQHYFKDIYGLEIDGSCRNVSRLCYVSDDPLMFSRPNAEMIPPRPPNVYHELAKQYGAAYTPSGKGGFQITRCSLRHDSPANTWCCTSPTSATFTRTIRN
jgi:BT4734-like, N-terminal domain